MQRLPRPAAMTAPSMQACMHATAAPPRGPAITTEFTLGHKSCVVPQTLIASLQGQLSLLKVCGGATCHVKNINLLTHTKVRPFTSTGARALSRHGLFFSFLEQEVGWLLPLVSVEGAP
jgi:hypothetical protein